MKAKQIERGGGLHGTMERDASRLRVVGTVLIKWSPMVTVVKTRQFPAVTPRYEANRRVETEIALNQPNRKKFSYEKLR